jgi:hypothetical protein
VEFISGVLNSTTPIIRSGAPISTTLQFRDAFGDILTTLPPFNVTVDVSTYDQKRLVAFGQRVQTASINNGAMTFADIGIYLQPNGVPPDNSVYSMNLTVTSSQVFSKNISIMIQACNIGEQVTDTYSCQRCRNDTFANDPVVGYCAPCPPGGDCSAGMLLPKKNFWQSTPLSPQVHRCPLPGSCTGNIEALVAFMASRASPALFQLWRPGKVNITEIDWHINMQNVSRTYTQMQCAPGHTGYLCGVCEGPKYGRFGFSCVECLPIQLNNAGIIVVVLLLAGILACTVYSHLRGTFQLVASVACLNSAHVEPLQKELPVGHVPPSHPTADSTPVHDNSQSVSHPQLNAAQVLGSSGGSQLRHRGKASSSLGSPDMDVARDGGMQQPTTSHSPAVPSLGNSSARRAGTKAKEFLTIAKVSLHRCGNHAVHRIAY